jgi:hypothetical protein
MITDLKTKKIIASPDYNLIFDKKNGFTARWGATEDDDPQWSPFGPEILDLEISSAAENDTSANNPLHIATNHGCHGLGCRQFCYKKNRPNKSVHMSLDTFKAIMDRMPKSLCSIAFGVLSPIEQHPQVWEIFEECRKRDVVPCVTINQELSAEVAKKLAKLCGAVAVSVNPHNREQAYNSIERLTFITNGCMQVNIHIVLSNDTVDFVTSVVDDIKNDPRLGRLNAMVMLSFKDKAHTYAMEPISSSYYREVIDYCLDAGINFGFDSCSAKAFSAAVADHPDRERLEQCVEPCESMMFSAYIDVNARLYACSFLENKGMWYQGINVLNHDDFMDIWNCKQVGQWRKKLLANERGCPEYRIGQ